MHETGRKKETQQKVVVVRNHVKGSERQCMVDELRMYRIVENFFRINLRQIKRFNGV